jgi:hypothetical protein
MNNVGAGPCACPDIAGKNNRATTGGCPYNVPVVINPEQKIL